MESNEMDLNQLTGQKVVLLGKASNAKAGAIVITDQQEVVYIAGLDEWDDPVYGKQVRVEGILEKKRIYPEIEADQPAASQGMAGVPFVLDMKSYRVEE